MKNFIPKNLAIILQGNKVGHHKYFFIIALQMLLCQELYAQLSPNYRIETVKNKIASGTIDRHAPLVAADVNPADKNNVDIFGVGAYTAALNQPESQNNQALGAAGLTIGNNMGQFTGSISINTSGTIEYSNQGSFGKAILVPGQGNSSLTFDYRKYNNLNAAKFKSFGWFVSLTGSTNAKWTYSGETVDAATLAPKIQVSFYPFPDLKTFNDNTLLVSFDLGYSSRWLIGDIRQNEAFRQASLGTKKTSFHGIELNGNLWINDLRLFFALPVLFGPNVQGLTGPQLLVGASLSGRAIRLSN
ncbi:hypothetical protein GCM10028808_40060 [Spirosoma migulaei]